MGRVAAACACWLAAMVSTAAWLATRPDCPDGYVRLVDFVPLFLLVAVVGVVVTGAGTVALFLAARRDPPVRHRVAELLALVSIGLAALIGVTAVVAIATDNEVGYARSCWTF